MPRSILTFCYVSRSCIPADEADAVLAEIVARSAERNVAAQITGALICAGEYLAQLIEGPGDAVWALRSRLEADPRHDALVVLDVPASYRRRFDGWALAYSGGSSYFARYLRQVHQGMAGPKEAERLILLMQQFVATSRNREKRNRTADDRCLRSG